MTALLWLLQGAADHVTWGPVSISGYVGLALSVISLIGIFVTYGRWLEKLNGMGKRVTVLEDGYNRAEAERAEHTRQIDRILDQHQDLLERLGNHSKTTEECREDTQKLGIDLGSKIHELSGVVSAMDKGLSVRLAQVEIKVESLLKAEERRT